MQRHDRYVQPSPDPEPLMPEPLDHRLRDDTVLDEIELTSRLMIAATELGRPLSQHEVDEILGVVAS
jgi:hypothetical protein